MKLLVLDLDGTLTTTNAVDEECFVQAFADVFGIRDVNTRWSEYDHVTDLGILRQVFRDTFGRSLHHNEIARFAECFVGLLVARHSSDVNLFGEIPGAASLLLNLKTHSEWRGAIATGCLEQSARFKWQAAQLPVVDFPAAFAENGPAREAIVRIAVVKAKLRYGQSEFEKIVLVGDAIWDLLTAQRLMLPFVGVGSSERAAALRSAGASTVIENFLDCEYFLKCCERAEIPKPFPKYLQASRQR